MRASAVLLVLLVLATLPLAAADKSTPGEFITEPATLISLGFILVALSTGVILSLRKSRREAMGAAG